MYAAPTQNTSEKPDGPSPDGFAGRTGKGVRVIHKLKRRFRVVLESGGCPMERDAMMIAGRRMLAEARSLRAAFPDAAAMWGMVISAPPTSSNYPALVSALGFLRDEMLLVQDGKAPTLGVMDDEMANVESLLSRL